jgi:hypothetical protein
MDEIESDLRIILCTHGATLSSEEQPEELIDELITDFLGGTMKATEMLSTIDAVRPNEHCTEELLNWSAQEACASIDALVAKLPRCAGAGCGKRQVRCWWFTQDEGKDSCGEFCGYCDDPSCVTRESETKDCAHCNQQLSTILWAGLHDDMRQQYQNDY